MPSVNGVMTLKFPVADLAASTEWYRRVLGLEVAIEFPDEDGVVRGVAGTIAGGVGVALRESPEHARGVTGFNLANFTVTDRAHLGEWVAHLDAVGVGHSPVIEASVGWIVVFHDPDGIEFHLYTQERHGVDHAGETGYGTSRR